jgi:hypothetical protein
MCNANPSFSSQSLRQQYRDLARFRLFYGLVVRRHSGFTQLLPRDADEREAAHIANVRRRLLEERPLFIVVADETAVLWNSVAPTSVALKAEKRAKVHTYDEKKSVTVMLSAVLVWVPVTDEFEVKTLPPFIIFKSNGQVHKVAKTQVNDATVVTTPNGWVTEESMLE